MNEVKSAKRVLEILCFFAQTQAPASLSQISTALGFPKSSCLALLDTLEAEGYAYQAAGRYYLTRRWLHESQLVACHDQITARARPILEELQRQLRETLILARRSGDLVLYLDAVEADQTVRFAAHAGQTKPLHASASGRALLSMISSAERRDLLGRLKLETYTDRTLTKPGPLLEQIEQGLKRGWHINVGEHQTDTLSIASAVSLHGTPYALVVGAPMVRAIERVNEIGQALADACRDMAHSFASPQPIP
jgi:IclR family transcriptional regulator, acetate operon repressor